ncbi:MAG: hypothetical protein Tsb009_27010 [Planctomycetaceae bacterium]
MDVMRAEGSRQEYFPARSDYPVPLLTRRAFGQREREILSHRTAAPCRVQAGSAQLSRRPRF